MDVFYEYLKLNSLNFHLYFKKKKSQQPDPHSLKSN